MKPTRSEKGGKLVTFRWDDRPWNTLIYDRRVFCFGITLANVIGCLQSRIKLFSTNRKSAVSVIAKS